MNSSDFLHQPLFTCDSYVNADEYGKMLKHFPSFYWACVKNGTLFIIIALILMGLKNESFTGSLLTAIFYEVLLMVVYKIRIEKMGQDSFHKIQKKCPIATQHTTDFYEDYFIRYSEQAIHKIEYSKISGFIETDSNFYVEHNGVFLFQKEKCCSELIEFFRNKCSHKLKSTSYFPVETFMLFLFILTLCCIFLGAKTMNILAGDSLNYHFVKYAWGFWIWLPIPLLSIILGFRYKKRGVKCTKNIISGFIVGIILLIFGCFCFFPIGESSYSKIYQYENVLNIPLPSDGILTENYYDTFGDSITKFTDIDVTFNRDDVESLEKIISSNPHWIPINEMASSLKIFIPDLMITTDTSYISIYNSSTQQYNTIPETDGSYRIYTMLFDSKGNRLEVNNYTYEYTN